MKIVIVDYDMGNIRSIQNKIRRLGYQSICSSSPEEINTAEKLILPGVGHFAHAMEKLNEYNLIDILNEKALKDKIPILGICLGIQLLTKWSAEGEVRGLGWVDAKTIKFDFSKNEKKYKIPHIGWNSIEMKKESPLLKGIDKKSLFYFVHSYHILCSRKEDILTETDYGEKFTSSIQKNNIFGTQFHPEKSHESGIEILKNFIERC